MTTTSVVEEDCFGRWSTSLNPSLLLQLGYSALLALKTCPCCHYREASDTILSVWVLFMKAGVHFINGSCAECLVGQTLVYCIPYLLFSTRLSLILSDPTELDTILASVHSIPCPAPILIPVSLFHDKAMAHSLPCLHGDKGQSLSHKLQSCFKRWVFITLVYCPLANSLLGRQLHLKCYNWSFEQHSRTFFYAHIVIMWLVFCVWN